MISLALRPAFVDFGPWTLGPDDTWPRGGLPVGGQPRESRKLLRRDAPREPGVYGMIDVEGELIYVGQSRSLRNRLLSYFTGSPPQKAQRIIARTRRLVWETAPDEFAALLRELELIRRWRPAFNVRGQPGRRSPSYVVVSREPGSRAYLAAVPAQGDTAVFGPVRGARACRQAVHALNDFFQLRTCGRQVPMHFAEQRELFDLPGTVPIFAGPPRSEEAKMGPSPLASAALCARRDMGICLAPCARGCSRARYDSRMRALKHFLLGDDLSVLAKLENAMRTAAAAKRFEEAAVCRDRWQSVANLHGQLDRLRTARRDYSFIYPVPRRDCGDTWYLIRRGEVLAALAAPQERQSASRRAATIEEIYGRGKSPSAAAQDDVEMALLVAGWFYSRPEELQRTFHSTGFTRPLSKS